MNQLTDAECKAKHGVPTEEGGIIAEADIEQEVEDTTEGVILGSLTTPKIAATMEPKDQLSISISKTHQNTAISMRNQTSRTATKNARKGSTKDTAPIFTQATKEKFFPPVSAPT